jgi:DNA ligase 1
MLCQDNVSRFVMECGGFQHAVWSVKKDGVRCIYNPADGTYTSRAGKQFKNFGCFDKDLKTLVEYFEKHLGIAKEDFLIDGEVIDESGKFSDLMTQVHRQEDVDPSSLVFMVFDIVLPEHTLSRRLNMLDYAFSTLHPVESNVRRLPHWECVFWDTEAEMKQWVEKFVADSGEEGIVLKNKFSFYEGGRSVNWCKVKVMHTLDLKVVGVVPGKGKNEGKVGALMCEYKGKEVKVGSGFTDEQRDAFLNAPPSLIEVKYQEITKDGSLRFPTFVKVREDKVEAN